MKACQHARMYTYSKVGLAWPSPGNCCVLSMAAPEPSGTTETTVPRNWSLEVQFRLEVDIFQHRSMGPISQLMEVNSSWFIMVSHK